MGSSGKCNKMSVEETVKKIIDRYNNGYIDEAKRLFFISQWSLPNETKEALKFKLGMKIKLNVKVDETLKTCCDTIGGKITEDGTEDVINALPCFICKKMIINSGIKSMICFQKDGSIKKYEIEDWVKDWQEKDMIKKQILSI